MPKANMNRQSVAAMMRRAPSPAESHLILAAPSNGAGSRWGEASARR